MPRSGSFVSPTVPLDTYMMPVNGFGAVVYGVRSLCLP